MPLREQRADHTIDDRYRQVTIRHGDSKTLCPIAPGDVSTVGKDS
jgi:hypothetical protein